MVLRWSRSRQVLSPRQRDTRFRDARQSLFHLETFRQVIFLLSLYAPQTRVPRLIASIHFRSLFETSQSLFWASFGLVDLTAFDLTGIKSFTRFWALLIFGCYSVINIIVLLNMLIAMMSNSYQIISVSTHLMSEHSSNREHLMVDIVCVGTRRHGMEIRAQ